VALTRGASLLCRRQLQTRDIATLATPAGGANMELRRGKRASVFPSFSPATLLCFEKIIYSIHHGGKLVEMLNIAPPIFGKRIPNNMPISAPANVAGHILSNPKAESVIPMYTTMNINPIIAPPIRPAMTPRIRITMGNLIFSFIVQHRPFRTRGPGFNVTGG